MMISIVGCIIGVLLGLVFCILQKQYGLISMDGQVTIMHAYPVDMKVVDFILVFFTVGIISVIAAGISARLSIKGLDDIKQDL